MIYVTLQAKEQQRAYNKTDRCPVRKKMNAKRGFVPEDQRNFSPEALLLLRRASRQVCYLLNEGYDLKQASTFVGNHYLLSERQRLAIMRSVASDSSIRERLARQRPIEALAGKEIWIDGFNIIITLEVIFSDSVFFRCMDGTVRDLAALRGTYRMIPETERAIRFLLDLLRKEGVSSARILLDEPVSNSGRLKAGIAELAQGYPFDLDIRIQREVDRDLFGKDLVATSDSLILDHCRGWVNPAAECLRKLNRTPLQVWE